MSHWTEEELFFVVRNLLQLKVVVLIQVILINLYGIIMTFVFQQNTVLKS